jgi:hypothetical protein
MAPIKMQVWEFAHLTWEKLLLARSYHNMIDRNEGDIQDLNSKIDACKQIFRDSIERLINYKIIVDGNGYLDRLDDQILAHNKSNFNWKYRPDLQKFGDWYSTVA